MVCFAALVPGLRGVSRVQIAPHRGDLHDDRIRNIFFPVNRRSIVGCRAFAWFDTTFSEADVACICERTLSTAMSGEQNRPACEQVVVNAAASVQHLTETVAEKHDSLKYHLLGPSLTKAGQDSVDQRKVRKHSLRPGFCRRGANNTTYRRSPKLSTMLQRAPNSSITKKSRIET